MGIPEHTPEWTRPTKHDPRSAVAAGRRLRRQTQAQLAAALNQHPGIEETWTATKVGKLEQGRKDFTVETLQAIAEIQRLSYAWYLAGPKHDDGLREAGLAQLLPFPSRKRDQRPIAIPAPAA